MSTRVASSPAGSPPLSPIESEDPGMATDSSIGVPDGEKAAEAKQQIEDEGEVPRVFASPGQPTQKQRDQHAVCHIPFRSWCDHCVRGRGRDRRSMLISDGMKSINSTMPRIVMDYG